MTSPRKPSLHTPQPSEADLCLAFIAWAAKFGWTAYAETAGWDILLVNANDGTQIGIQAKKVFNATLLRQALPDRYIRDWQSDPGPDFRAVLLPRWDHEAWEVCQFCGLIYFHPGGYPDVCSEFKPDLDANQKSRGWRQGSWQHWPAGKRIVLPAYIPDIPAGASAPVQLTEWKIAALKICALLEIKGSVTRADFKRVHIDYRRWVLGAMGWLELNEAGDGYRRGKSLNFDKQHPVVYQQVLEDVRREEAGWAELRSLPVVTVAAARKAGKK